MAGVLHAIQRSAVTRRGCERLVRLETRVDEKLDLPGQVAGAPRTAAEVGAGRDRHPRPLRGRDRRVRTFFALRYPLASFRRGEAVDRRRAGEGLPGRED